MKWGNRLSSLRNLTRHRIIDGEVIAPDARVDPDAFPDDTFPVYCTQCNYPLRGLAEPRCPECGSPFDRGRLLVEQYVIEQGKRIWKRTGQYAKGTLIIGVTLTLIGPLSIFVGPFVLDQLLASLNPSQSATQWLVFFANTLRSVQIVGFFLILTSAALHMHLARIGQSKRLQVLNGIDHSTPSFQAAQKRKWIPSAILGFVLLAWLVQFVRSSGSWFREYRDDPTRIIFPAVLMVSLLALFVMANRFMMRWLTRAENDDNVDNTDDAE